MAWGQAETWGGLLAVPWCRAFWVGSCPASPRLSQGHPQTWSGNTGRRKGPGIFTELSGNVGLMYRSFLDPQNPGQLCENCGPSYMLPRER